jgi:RHH-type transcriptional regulator, rel operon repressor / antitoxin RelB
MGKTISVRIPDEIYNHLGIIAKENERSKSYHIVKALESYLEEQADFQIALDRLKDTNDRSISEEDLRKELGL